ncbi:hypothetical protein ACXR0O_29350 [Verrucomicrobiota bacterium sgz303538]
MTELHPSISAVGTHFDEEVETTLHASSSQMESKRTQTKRSAGNEMREGEIYTVSGGKEFLPDNADLQVEEMMHLGQ